jgi:membrane protease subunit HflK
MSIFLGRGGRIRGLFADTKGPWGPTGSGDEPPADDGQGGGPWGESTGEGRRASSGRSAMTPLDELLRRGRMRFRGGGGGGFPGRPERSLIIWAILGFIAIWLVFTSVHSISPGQRGVVTRFGRYSYTLGPGVGITLPSPIERVQKVDVESIRSVDLGSQSSEDLMLTGDQNLLDIAYSVRWNIRAPELYLFQLSDPDEMIRQVAESAMRSVIAQVTLQEAMGDRRSEIEAQVTDRMQHILNAYRSGVAIQGVAIQQADPPAEVNDAFKEVTAAQQDAKSYVNQANAYALQLTAKAQGEAAAFDKVYAQYKLAPGVTRRRMYYETMEQVLSKVDKTIVEAPGVTPYLPLPQVKKEQQQDQERQQ